MRGMWELKLTESTAGSHLPSHTPSGSCMEPELFNTELNDRNAAWYVDCRMKNEEAQFPFVQLEALDYSPESVLVMC